MKISDYVEKRLIAWGQWYAKMGDMGLGYPHRSVEGRLKDEGGVLPRGFGSRIPICDEAEEIEALVVELHRWHSRQAEALRIEYLDIDTLYSKAKKMGVSRNTFVTQRDLAKAWIEGRMKALY